MRGNLSKGKAPRGERGEPGNDGYSPKVTVEPTERGYEVTIQDKHGLHTFYVENGKDGASGDLNQNDSTKADYIKNRTHFIEYQGEKTFDDYEGLPWIEFTPSTLIRNGERHAGNIDWLISGNAYGLKFTGYLGNDTVFTYENTITATSSNRGVVLSTEEYENSIAWADSPVHFIIEEDNTQRVDNYTFSVADDIDYDRVEIEYKGTFYRERIKSLDSKFLSNISFYNLSHACQEKIATKEFVKEYVEENSGSTAGDFEMDYDYVDTEISKVYRYVDEKIGIVNDELESILAGGVE